MTEEGAQEDNREGAQEDRGRRENDCQGLDVMREEEERRKTVIG